MPDRDELVDGTNVTGRVAGSPVRHGAGWTMTSLPAEVDIANADQVHDDLDAAVAQGYPIVIVDMSRTSFCDCAGVSVLLAAASQALRGGAEIRIVARARPVLRTFELTGLRLVLKIYRTAVEAQRGPPGAIFRPSRRPRPRPLGVPSQLTPVDLPSDQVSGDVLDLLVRVLRQGAQPLECHLG